MRKDLGFHKCTLLQSLKKGDEVALKEIMELLKPALVAEAKHVLYDEDNASYKRSPLTSGSLLADTTVVRSPTTYPAGSTVGAFDKNYQRTEE